MLDLSAIDGVLVEEANRMDEEILQNKLYVSPWVELVDVDQFPEGMGNAISQVTYQPTRYSALTWADVGGTNSGNAVTPAVSTVASAKDVLEYKLQHVALESERLNLNDLRTASAAETQLAAVSDNLSFNTHRLLEERARAEYSRVAQIQAVCDSYTAPTEGTITSGYATMPTTAAITWVAASFHALLAKFRMRMLRMGAGNRPLDKVDNSPVFGLICDSEVSDALKADLGENLRFAGRSNELLAPFGCDGVYKNFFHIIDDLLPRYTFSSGYTEVAPETDAAAGDGTKRIANSAYETASYTDVIIYHQDVMKLKVPNTTVGRQGSGVSFEPRNYRGEWTWLNIKDVDSTTAATYNPDGAIGFFRGVINQATQTRKNLFGVRIRIKRPGM